MDTIVFIKAIIAMGYTDLQSRYHNNFEFFNDIQSWTESDRYYEPAYTFSHSNDALLSFIIPS